MYEAIGNDIVHRTAGIYPHIHEMLALNP